jgi:hypothetical protein
MPELPFEFEVFCKTCGEGLCHNCTEGTTPRRGMPFIQVEPCETCIDNAKDEGHDRGYEEALEEAENGNLGKTY